MKPRTSGFWDSFVNTPSTPPPFIRNQGASRVGEGICPIYGTVVSGHALLESPPQLWRVAGAGDPPSILILWIKIPAHKLGFVKALFQEFCEKFPAWGH